MPDKIVPLWKVVGEVSEMTFLDHPVTSQSRSNDETLTIAILTVDLTKIWQKVSSSGASQPAVLLPKQPQALRVRDLDSGRVLGLVAGVSVLAAGLARVLAGR